MLNVLAIPAFDDNYLWLVHDGRHAVAIDPGDAAPIISALATRGLTLCAILLTHHHADHVGGVPALLQHWQIPVYGPRHDNIACLTNPLDDGDLVHVEQLGLDLTVIAVPGHTRGHIAYHAAQPGWLFCGDTLFGAGCGRIFEGTPAQMAASLARLAALPEATQVYCAHEYTLSNLRFARTVEPGNAALMERLAADTARRAAGVPTVPSSIGLEKATNPFLRYAEAEILESLRQAGRLREDTPLAAFAALREWKNVFK
ncbi:hydroxyacylglutathione hydrolase [Noviherbaspirillum sedimenti]|uniref:Hydroxyacylglutathione hydrolase n=1 Tax=Noviherbaspirillum sedimenti TaxID=2320865 RepID=A0A3A3FZB9_9BURK|nr:hydroxyacylglutathione hydrolase [Noviherbaspirillum sedimenti]RJG01503.1 hydroxyacylglutathione hydrolase [Noviherbaspirillum sedimenti]